MTGKDDAPSEAQEAASITKDMMKTIELKELRSFVNKYNRDNFPTLKPFKVKRRTYSDFAYAGLTFYGCDMGSISPILSIPEARQEWAEFNQSLAGRFDGVSHVTDKGEKMVAQHILTTARHHAKASR